MKQPAADTLERIITALEWAERNLDAKIRVADVARRAYYSPFHFHRMFSGLTGEPLMDFIRRRRLTVAARALSETKRPIIEIAFDVGFDSQEAFTRAFKLLCGTTPGRYRRGPRSGSARFTAPLDVRTLASMCGEDTVQAKFIDLPEFLVVGLPGRFVVGKTAGIPKLWEEFIRRWCRSETSFPAVSYGVCYDESDGCGEEAVPFTYLAAFPLEPDQEVPKGLETRTLPANHYAVFTHRGSILEIQHTYAKIFGTWLPPSGYRRGAGPDFELYDERFDEKTMSGEVDIYVPVVKT